MTAQKNSPTPHEIHASHHETIKTVHSVRRWVVVLAGVVVASWVVIGIAIFRSRASSPAGYGAYATTKPMEPGNGPWGRLEYSPIVISSPLEYVAEGGADFSGPVMWHFPDMGSARLSTRLRRSGLDSAIVAELEKNARANVSLPGMSIHPSKEFILSLNASDRAKLYLMLADYPQNLDIRNQFLFRGDSPQQWFDGSDVSPATIKLVEPLIYKNGNFMYFADMRSISADIPSRREQLELLRTLRRDVTFLAHIRLSEESDLEQLVNYWGRGGRIQDVRPILESMMRREGGVINITHLLPPLARRRLYTYPAMSRSEQSVHRDCHWTSMNFFNEIPDDSVDMAKFHSEIKQKFYRIHGNLQLGDIAVVIDERKTAVHSATYIADDVFFHRCGSDSSAPWTFVRGEDLKDYYTRSKKPILAYYRRRNM